MAATIEDVARRAAVSVATVSRALRGLPNVAPSTRERVMTAASELHYVADPSASRLAGGRNLTVGFVVPMLGQWYYAKLFSGVEAVLTVAGYDVLPFTMSGPGGVRRFVETLPFRKRVDGLIVADAPLEPAQFRRIEQAEVDLVTIGTLGQGIVGLSVDNVAAARLAVGHLTGLGHRRIAQIGGIVDDPFHFSVPVDRYHGYRDALEAAGIGHDEELAVPGNFSLEGGAEAMHRLLALDEPPTAVFACSDEMAIGAMQVARDAGLRVPEDLSIVGIDDHDVSEYVGLTTIRQDVVGQGERAAQRLLELSDPATSGPLHEHLPIRLIVRRTTGPPPPGVGFRW
ncbi:MAG: LacI family DNA-binding transcriptional regulator [Nitriliruptoraceae bacterium]|nr:LacI family DNA-binding transcriptional regulator [Nitriliruptoraceae bacterium]